MGKTDAELEFDAIVLAKLDTVIQSQATLLADIGHLKEGQAALGDGQAELTRTVRGFNGTSGLVTKIEVLEARCEQMHKTPTQPPAPPASRSGSGALSTKWLTERIVSPVIVAFLVWFLLTILPQTIAHLSKVP